MSKLHKKLSPIQKLAFTSIALTVINILYFNYFSKSLAAHQQHMQARQVQAQKPSNNKPTPVPVSAAKVVIKSFQFQPNNIIVKKGGKVTFTNKDSASHTATPEKGSQFKGTARLAANESQTVVFNTVGVHNYFCELHPGMKGKITVVN